MASTPQGSTSFTTRSPVKNTSDANPYAHMSFNNGQNMSFSSQNSQSLHPQHRPLHSHGHGSQNGAMQQSPYRSFNESSQPPVSRQRYEDPQIYTAVYSGVSVYEVEVNGVACMRRLTDGWLNATQILKVAGVDKGKRTKVLEKEILTGEHEKVQGGYGKYQGTWINYNRGREFCRQYGVEEMLRPLLEYDLNGDGTNAGRTQETPTKEQAMAANRKKFYNAGADNRANPQLNHGTFFSNISPMSSVALAAMNKAARLNSPAPSRSAGNRPPSQLMRRQSQNQGGAPNQSQQSMASENSFSGELTADSGYGTQNGMPVYRNEQEPPRKRMRQSQDDSMISQPALPLDVSMRSATPTEPNESFLYSQQTYADTFDGEDPITQPPLPAPTTPEGEEKRALLLDLFAGESRADYASHPALTQLSADDYNTPLDPSANTALHWAATLARVPLLSLLLRKGANMWRGNAAGQSALISAVLVNNCWEHSCFPDLLELLGPLIEVRDAQGRTILHHIAVACGIKGRAPSSKYYLEALLEFLVRSVTHSTGVSANSVIANMGQNGDSSQDSTLQSSKGPMSLMRFLSTIVNATDKAGNTALNLVARIGNRSIIQQLLEIKADPNIANLKGVSARDFGVGVDDGEYHVNGAPYHQQSEYESTLHQPDLTIQGEENALAGAGNQTDDQNQDVISSLTSMLTQNLTQHKDALASKTAQIDLLNAQIKELSASQKLEMDQFTNLQRRSKLRDERTKKIENLRRVLQGRRSPSKRKLQVGEADDIRLPEPHELQRAAGSLPPASTLRTQISAYSDVNASLSSRSAQLKSRSVEVENLYRRAVSLCTNVPEAKVEEALSSLVAAVESERGSLGREEVGRVREFLMKVEGVGTTGLRTGVEVG